MHKLYLLDLGMFGEKWVCEYCRTEHYSARPIEDVREVPDDPEDTRDTCGECWV